MGRASTSSRRGTGRRSCSSTVLIPALAGAGFRAIAVDVRGFGASDKPPTGYDLTSAAADLAGLIHSLGEDQATVIGHGLGAWTVRHLPVFAPAVVRAVGLVSVPAPPTISAYGALLPRPAGRRYRRALTVASATARAREEIEGG